MFSREINGIKHGGLKARSSMTSRLLIGQQRGPAEKFRVEFWRFQPFSQTGHVPTSSQLKKVDNKGISAFHSSERGSGEAGFH